MGKKLLTFDEWNAAGYVIIKGEKHVDRNLLGVCVFSEDQVKKRQPRKEYKSNPYYRDYNEQKDLDYAIAFDSNYGVY